VGKEIIYRQAWIKLHKLVTAKSKLGDAWRDLKARGIPLTMLGVFDVKEGVYWAAGGTLHVGLEDPQTY
jgi:hypothetical protein